MRSVKLPWQIFTWFRRQLSRSRLDAGASQPGRYGNFGALRSWLLVGIAAGMAWWGGTSCVVTDPDYCATRAQCPFTMTDMGSVQQLCHPTRHVCLASGSGNLCSYDGDCLDPKLPHCDTTSNLCTTCRVGDTTDTSCAHIPNRPMCANANDGSGPVCVACQTNLDCMNPAAPICDSQQCRKCSAHSDCEGTLNCDNGTQCTDSLVCIGAGDLTPELVGACAQNGSGASGRVVYVNPDPAKCDKTQGFLFSTPVCNLDDAVDQANSLNRRFIRIVDTETNHISGLGLHNTLADNVAYSFIGAPVPSQGFPNKAILSQHGSLVTRSGTGSLTLDSLTLRNENPDESVFRCVQSATQVPTLIVRNCDIVGSTPPTTPMPKNAAINITNCTTIMDGNVIGVGKLSSLTDMNAYTNGKGLYLADTNPGGTSILIQNNIFAGNAGAAMDFEADSGATARFVVRFNTIIGNGRGTVGSASGVLCPLASEIELSHSIITGNSTGGGSQFYLPAGCNAKDIVVGATEAASAAFSTAPFDPDPTFRLQATDLNRACCVDKVSPLGAEILPTTDIDGHSRPQNVKWDIGASELKQ